MKGFLLTRDWRDTPQGIGIELWAATDAGPICLRITRQDAVCFVPSAAVIDNKWLAPISWRRKSTGLATLQGDAVDALYVTSQYEMPRLRQSLRQNGIRVYESDLKPADRYLMERFIGATFEVRGESIQHRGWQEFVNPAIVACDYGIALRRAALDIEIDAHTGTLLSIAVSGGNDERVFVLGPPTTQAAPHADSGFADKLIDYLDDEAALLRALCAWIQRHDPDIITGWNVVNFDLAFLARRASALRVPLQLGRGGAQATLLAPQSEGQMTIARIPGRVVLDGIDTLRAAFWSFESFGLEAVARELLGRGKLIGPDHNRIDEVIRLYETDKVELAAYNIEDCRLVQEIFAKAGLVDFAMQRARLTGLALDRHGGSVAAFDNLYLPRLHRKGFVAPDVGSTESGAGSPGGYVMDSRPGLYDNVLVLDFKSLYPSIIRTFNIDPLGLSQPGSDPLPGYDGAEFARGSAILPELIESLWQSRDEAKAQHDAPLSQAIKIIMNSFYGVLGTNGCRFYDSRLASSITRRGHEIILQSREQIEHEGLEVIYGDTDSLFVLIGAQCSEPSARDTGRRLAGLLNDWWTQELARHFGIQSYLEIEFETLFIRFLMPTIRGTDKGSKKRYAGYIRTSPNEFELVFKGLESVRTDWTPLAREFQRELYRRVFFSEPFHEFVKQTVTELMSGALDNKLVYRKRIRRPLDAYKRNVPPHVQAARKQKNPGRAVRYVITQQGPEPIDNRASVIDYDHYRERQLKPVADSILQFVGANFDEIVDEQLTIF